MSCRFCNNGKENDSLIQYNQEGRECFLDIDGRRLTIEAYMLYGESLIVARIINYCPMCGREL